MPAVIYCGIFPFFDKLVLILILVLTSILRVLQNTPTGWTITNSLKYTRAYGKSNSNELGFDLADNSLSSNIKSLQAFSKKMPKTVFKSSRSITRTEISGVSFVHET